MSHRINVMVDDAAWSVLKKLPRGERSRALNTAIVEWACHRKRRDAAARMDAVRAELPSVSTEELVGWIREDREQ